LQALLDVPDDRVFHQMPTAFKVFAAALCIGPGTQHLEDVVGVPEIRLTLFDVAAQRSEGRTRFVTNFIHHRLYGIPTEVAAPGDARSLEIAFEPSRKDRSGLFD